MKQVAERVGVSTSTVSHVSMAEPTYEMVRRLTGLLIARVRGEAGPLRCGHLPGRLVARQSSGRAEGLARLLNTAIAKTADPHV
jgi:DNA-binding LacI/PurR family transcriptional regulator